MRTNCPGSNGSRDASTRSEKSASVQCLFSSTRASSHLLMDSSLHPVRLQLQVLELAPQHDDGAVPPVIAGVGELEGIGPRDFQLPVRVARQSEPRKRHRLIQKLQRVALAGRAPRFHCALARAQAVEPEKNPCGDEENRGTFPHVTIYFGRDASARSMMPRSSTSRCREDCFVRSRPSRFTVRTGTPSRSTISSNARRLSKVSPQVRNTRSTTISSATRIPSPSSNPSGARAQTD